MSRDELPLPEFGQLPLESAQSRIRALGAADQLGQLIQYDHGYRLPVLQVLEHRMRELRDGAEPTSGDPAAFKPEMTGSPSSDSAVGPNPGPAINPPAHGDPTNPSQPRT